MNSVVKLTCKNDIAVLSLEDRESKNTFTDELNTGIINRFEEIKNNTSLKVVIIHGYDNYFCCGGTQKELIKLREGIENGEMSFKDLVFFDIAQRCEIPVIAAMQGHAIGGGLAFGCYSDIIVMGEQCIYSANFMKYGFTPGMGATYIIPRKFGETIGHEMLLTARNYRGYELKKRGVPVQIVPKEKVIETAMDIAYELAEKPLLSLKILKKHLIREMRDKISDIIHQEMEMHQVSFLQPEVLERIQQRFGN